VDPTAALLIQRLKSQPGNSLTPAKQKPVKRKKKERIDTTFLKSRAQLHIPELIARFFPDGRLGPNEQYWITPELRISISTGCVWKNFSQGYSRRPCGDVVTLFLIARDFLVPEERESIKGNGIEALKARLANRGPYRFANEGDFQRGVESLSTWLEQFPERAEVHELLGYDS
jgi:hypothetical protein